MDKIEIYKDIQNIAKDIEICQNAKETIQSLYDEFAVYGCNLTIEKIHEIAGNTKFGNIKDEFVMNAVKDIIINYKTGTETPTILGLTISKESLRDMIVVSNMKEIINSLRDFSKEIWNVKDLISIQDGKAIISNDFEITIEKKHTVFAEGKKQIDRAKVLINLRDAMNEYLKEKIVNTVYGFPIVIGLNTDGKEYVIDPKFIKQL